MSIGFYFDMTRCTGCRACQVACKDKNRLDVGTLFRNAHSYSVGAFPDAKGYSYSFSCNHCETPGCMAVCPTGAIYKADDGAVLVDYEICIGCGSCTSGCPYGVPQLIESLNKMGKCDSCYAIRMDGGRPACVAGCPNRALDFGELDDLEAKYGSDLVDKIAVLPDPTTGPSLRIRAKGVAQQADFAEVSW